MTKTIPFLQVLAIAALLVKWRFPVTLHILVSDKENKLKHDDQVLHNNLGMLFIIVQIKSNLILQLVEYHSVVRSLNLS